MLETLNSAQCLKVLEAVARIGAHDFRTRVCVYSRLEKGEVMHHVLALIGENYWSRAIFFDNPDNPDPTVCLLADNGGPENGLIFATTTVVEERLPLSEFIGDGYRDIVARLNKLGHRNLRLA